VKACQDRGHADHALAPPSTGEAFDVFAFVRQAAALARFAIFRSIRPPVPFCGRFLFKNAGEGTENNTKPNIVRCTT
jgi:hypothetical protein